MSGYFLHKCGNEKLFSQCNILNLPSHITFADGSSIEYEYAADGRKVRTTHTINNNVTSTVYCGNAVYENGVPKTLLTEAGFVSLNDRIYHYYLKDHQGNNRVVTYWNGSKWFVEQVNHYYPFGGVFLEGTAVSNQAYKYNGKELDRMHGLDWYDYSARMHDAALGRFTTMDPLAEKYYSVSPYAYCANSPFNNVDLDGKSWYSYNQDGKTIYEWNINIRSQEDLDKIRENAIYIGNTHSDGDTYYSLFGNKYSIDSKEGKTMEKIDEALINYSQESLKYDY